MDPEDGVRDGSTLATATVIVHVIRSASAGRDWPVVDRLSVGRRQYLILEKTGSADRSRFMAFDPYAGPDGDLRAILVLPRSPAAEQHIRVLKRISANNINLPTILEYRTRKDELLVVLTWVRGMDLQNFLKKVRDARRPRPSATEAFRLVRGLGPRFGPASSKARHCSRRHQAGQLDPGK